MTFPNNKTNMESYNCLGNTNKSIKKDHTLAQRMHNLEIRVCKCEYYIEQLEQNEDNKMFSQIDIQSEDMNDDLVTETMVNVTFEDTVAITGEEPLPDVITPSEMYSNELDIVKYMQRPRQIATGTFAQGATYGVTVPLAPFDLFLNDAAIKRKWNNYKYWKGSLKIELVVNSTPFLYGMWLADWVPLPSLSAYNIASIYPATVANSKQALCNYSQRNKILIEPHKNARYELTLPFIYQNQWHKFSTTATDMGTLTLRPVVPIRAASATTSDPTFTIYASFENFELCGPTVIVQSSDVYHNGPISKPASIVAAAASKLTAMPIIGKFARATEIGAGAVSDMAATFGFCKKPDIVNATAMNPQTAYNLGSGETSMVANRVTIDPKQEITRDRSRIGFTNEDELNIASLASRPAIVSIADWNISDIADQQISGYSINPNMSPTLTAVGTYAFPTPAAWMGSNFDQWRGTAVFTLNCVKSKYHTGRLLVAFDPNSATASSALAAQIKNVVWDITKSDELEIRVPFLADTAWLNTNPNVGGNISERNGVALNVGTTSTGIMQISVLNRLTAPLTTATVGVVVRLHWEDLQYGRPKAVPQTLSPWSVQSADLVDTTRMATIEDSNYVGQEILSMRQLMNRTEFVKNFPLRSNDGTNMNLNTYVIPQIPLPRGYSGGFENPITKGTIDLVGDYRYNNGQNTTLAYYTCAFVGYRGSAIHTFVPYASENIQYFLDVTVAPSTTYGRTVTAVPLAGGTVNAYNISNKNSQRLGMGSAIGKYTTNEVVSIVSPWMDSEDFHNIKRSGAISLLPWSPSVTVSSAGVSSFLEGNQFLQWYAGAGADFDVFGFVNTPVISLISASPTYVSE